MSNELTQHSQGETCDGAAVKSQDSTVVKSQVSKLSEFKRMVTNSIYIFLTLRTIFSNNVSIKLVYGFLYSSAWDHVILALVTKNVDK
jgi:hypothetical protein